MDEPWRSKSSRKPAFTANVRKNGGFFKPAIDAVPAVPLEATMLKNEPEIYEKLVATVKNNGTFGPNSYYRNHKVNAEWTKEAVNNGDLKFPFLFIGAEYDTICDVVNDP